MNKDIIEKLMPITAEEEQVLESGEIDLTIYNGKSGLCDRWSQIAASRQAD